MAMCISRYCVDVLGITVDVSRLGAQVINGIGFLGAGTIIVTRRQEVKELVATLSKDYPNLKHYVFGAMQRLPLPEWGPVEHRRRPLPEEIGDE